MQWRKLTDNVSCSVQDLRFTVLLLCICYLRRDQEAALQEINFQAISVLHTIYIFNVLADQCSCSLQVEFCCCSVLCSMVRPMLSLFFLIALFLGNKQSSLPKLR